MNIFKKKPPSAQQLLGIDEITEHSIRTPNGELVYLILKPSNLNVLPESIVRQRIHSLMNVLKGMAEVEILATDSKESYQDNRSFYRKRLEEETNPAIRALLEADCAHLDSVQTSMASARTFCLILRQRGEGGFTESYLANVEKHLSDNGFTVHRANEQELRELLAVYYEQDVSHEVYDSVDGERYVKEI